MRCPVFSVMGEEGQSKLAVFKGSLLDINRNRTSVLRPFVGARYDLGQRCGLELVHKEWDAPSGC